MSKSFFEQRIELFKQKEISVKKLAQRISNIRLVTFIVTAITAYFLFKESQSLLAIASIILGIAALLILVKKHQRAKRQQSRFAVLQKLNREEIKRLALDIQEFETGDEFIDPKHPYLIDLDIFGKHSLFQLINRTTTSLGYKQLGELLKNHANRAAIVERQELIRELSGLIDFRQEFSADGKLDEVKTSDVNNFINWLKSSTKSPYKSIAYLTPIIFILTSAATVFYFTEFISGWIAGLAFLPSAYIFKRYSQQIKKHKLQSAEKVKVLNQIQLLTKHIENTEFKSSKANRLKQALSFDSEPASKAIAQLHSLFSNLDSTNNPVWGFIANAFFVWDARYVGKIEIWRNTHKEASINWLEAIAEFDAMISLSGFAHLNDNYCYPEITEGDYLLKAQDLGHPLIDTNGGVRNNLELNGSGKVNLITGSNMSGKSTFQRTVALNLVMAQIGLPVCASKYQLSLMSVFTSMRTIDSIEESTSSFYAELKRLKQLIETAKNSTVLYFIDEILKGTNSEDRHKGARGIAIQLSKIGASGFISTHDLYLTQLSNDLGDKLTNYSFNSEIIDDEIIFDYKLTLGACKSFNASQLMKNMGLGFTQE